ncbi:MAG TPA: IgGFc-binding protein, partial [Polyangiaceae bacterium]
FLSGDAGAKPQCPVQGATANESHQASGVFDSFRISTDVPVVAYQINPYGGGSVAVTGASLLLPTSAWDVNYVAADAYAYDNGIGTASMPSLNIIAAEDGTVVKFTPNAAVVAAPGIPGGPAGAPIMIPLSKGQNAQISQTAELTGSIIETNKPVGLMAGQRCLRVPIGTSYCDHGEQMVPPVKALGHEYVGVMYRPRSGEPAIWRVIGAVDGTQLTYSSAVGGPTTLNLGQIAEFTTGTPFVVSSQDAMHPFMLFSYMSGSTWTQLQDKSGYGDADVVISVPPEQYLSNYVFFADPTYPETNLVIVRKKVNNAFTDVTLDCAGILAGWAPVGADYEWTRADLMTGNFQNVGNCSTGRHAITSTQPFGLWVWGWGTPLTSPTFTENVSYGYPGGMNVQPINNVVVHM